MRRDQIHERRREAVVGLKAEFLEARTDGPHLVGLGAGLDDRGHEGGEPRLFPTLLLGEFGVEEIKAVKRMRLVLDAAVHVHAAAAAGVALNGGFLIDDLQLVAIRGHADVVAAADADYREPRPLRLSAFGAAAGVVKGYVGADLHGHRVARALTGERATGEVRGAFLDSVIDRGVNFDCHVSRASPLRGLYTGDSIGLLHGCPKVRSMPQQSMSMDLAVNGAPADVQSGGRRAHIPLARLEHAAQRIALRATQYALAVATRRPP